MNLKAILLLCMVWVCTPGLLHAAPAFNKATYYSIMSGADVDKISHEIELIQNAPGSQAYEGALLMRKAGLMAKPKDRLKYFKEGRIKFDAAITAEPDNGEYHFLRLTIQENAPNIVKYKSDIDSDKRFIIQHFKSLPAVVQKAIIDYSKNSQVLHNEDFNFTG